MGGIKIGGLRVKKMSADIEAGEWHIPNGSKRKQKHVRLFLRAFQRELRKDQLNT